MLHETLRELHPTIQFGIYGVAGLLWLALMYGMVEVIVRVHAWWTR